MANARFPCFCTLSGLTITEHVRSAKTAQSGAGSNYNCVAVRREQPRVSFCSSPNKITAKKSRRTGDIRNVYTSLNGTPESKRLGENGVLMRMILKWILRKYGIKMNRIYMFRDKTSDGLL